MTDLTPTAGAPERIGVEFSATVESWSDEHPALIGIRPGDDCREYPRIGERVTVHRSVGPLATDPAPDLLAAVEALRKTPTGDPWDAGWNAGLDALLRSAPASREAGLDAERLSDVIHADLCDGSASHHHADCTGIAKRYAAEYALLRSAPASREAGLDAERLRGTYLTGTPQADALLASEPTPPTDPLCDFGRKIADLLKWNEGAEAADLIDVIREWHSRLAATSPVSREADR